MGLMNMGFPRSKATKVLVKRLAPAISKVTPAQAATIGATIGAPVPPPSIDLSSTGPIMSQVPMQSAAYVAQTPTQPPSYAPSLDLTDTNRSPGLVPQYTPAGQPPTDMPFPQPVPVNHAAIATFGGVGLLVVGVGLYLVLKRK